MLYTVKRYLGIIVFVVVIMIGLIYFNMTRSLEDHVGSEEVIVEGLIQPEDDLIEENDTEAEASQELFVDIKGAIASPGVYEMQAGDRMTDIITRAGGFTNAADETQINLAQKLQDEMVIIVPKEGEERLDTLSPLEIGGPGESSNTIQINSATQAELETLNGVGPSKAQAIIDYREEHGPFKTVEDILEVSGIGEKTLDSFKEDIVVP